MAQDGKKISFSFSKSIKKPDLKSTIQVEHKKVDYIEYVDDKSIKVIGEEKAKDEPLIIPMLGSKSWHERIINKINADIYGTSSEDTQKNGNAKQTDENKKSSNGDAMKTLKNASMKVAKTLEQNQKEISDIPVSLEELAAQELIQDLQEDDSKEEPAVDLSIEQSKHNLIGEKESTLENYEEIPIEKFGMALLRGMGWEPEKGIGKNSKVVSVTVPNLRPRGMGLGADKVILPKKKVQSKTKEEIELKLERGSYVRIIAGKYVNNYGQLESFDDEAGRLIIKLALGNQLISLNEYLTEAVTKDDYMKNSKVLNISTYEKFSNKLDRKQTLNSSETDEVAKKEDENWQNKRSNHNKKTSKYREKSDYSNDESSNNSDGKYKRKHESNDKDDYYKSKKLKKHRRHDDSELSRKNSKKDKDRERTRDRSKTHHHSSSKSSDKKKHKKHKRSRSNSFDRR